MPSQLHRFNYLWHADTLMLPVAHPAQCQFVVLFLGIKLTETLKYYRGNSDIKRLGERHFSMK